MITAPAEYLSALRHSHESVIRVTAYENNLLVGTLPVVGGELTLSGRADIRRTAELQVAVDPLQSETRNALESLSTQRGEIVIEHGVGSGNGLVGGNMIQLARMRIDSISATVSRGSRSIRLFDRALLIQEHKFPTAHPMEDTYVNLIKTLIEETLPGEIVTVGAGVSTTLRPTSGKVISRGDDRLRRCQEFADALNAWLINDPNGGFTIEAWPATGLPVWDISGGAEGVLIDVSQEFARREQYNAVGIEFTPADPETQFNGFIYLWDNDPTSITYYDGPFGKRNIFFSEEYDHLPSTAEAQAVATKKLLEYSGATRQVSLDAVYNPVLLPGDRITLGIPDQDAEIHVIEDMSLSFGDSAKMSITTRLDRGLNVIGGL